MKLNLPEIEPLGRDAEGHIEDPYARGQHDRDRQVAAALRERAEYLRGLRDYLLDYGLKDRADECEWLADQLDQEEGGGA